MEDVLHVHGQDDGFRGGGEVTNQLHLLLQPDVAREAKWQMVEVVARAQLGGGKGDASPLSNP
jgi:hypothetical protein